jgi:hypothetical protein
MGMNSDLFKSELDIDLIDARSEVLGRPGH